MTIPTVPGHGEFLIGFLLLAFTRSRSRVRAAIQHQYLCDVIAPESRERLPLDRLPDSSSLAGVPLRVLHSDYLGPGALLRDTVMIRPSLHNNNTVCLGGVSAPPGALAVGIINHSMLLTLSKSSIRSFRPDDAASIATHIGTYSVARNMLRIPHPYSLQDAEQWIEIATKPGSQTNFGIAIDDQIVGGVGLDVNPSGVAACGHSAEIGYWLGETFWGRGIATEALNAMSEWAFRELHLVRLYAKVFARNQASARVLEKAGYVFEGRLLAHYFRDGEYIDGLLYAKVRLPR